jgi:DUF4097 and DUF4098 domain-containing protein YvlB
MTGRLIGVSILSVVCAIGGCSKWTVQYDRTEQVRSPLAGGSLVAVETHNGRIKVSRSEPAECRVVATIHASADTTQEAKDLVEKAKVKLVPSGKTLTVELDKPVLLPDQSVWADYDITVPKSTDLKLSAYNGSVAVTGTAGKVAAVAHNGSMIMEGTSGPLDLETHNGQICVKYAKEAPSICNVSLVTYNGEIDFTPPPNLSARVDFKTYNGRIKTDLPLTVKGTIGRRIQGTVGKGEGNLHLETHNGSIILSGDNREREKS